MKLIIVLLCCILMCGCEKKTEKVIEKRDTKVVEEVKVYQDSNSMPIAFYSAKDGVFTKIDYLEKEILQKKDIVTCQVYPSNLDSIVLNTKKGEAFYNEWISIDSNHQIKQGFIIEYELKDNTIIKQQILGPDTTQLNYDYIEIYLYDAYTHRNDDWYSHIEESEMNDNTFFTSIKLTGGAKVDDISSKIKLTTFTYDSLDDFDSDGYYRGNSYHTIEISNYNK